jgi:DNA-binding NarL/FixJ family response regulator
MNAKNASSAAEASEPRKISVFLADDHAVIRDCLRMFLEAQPDMCVTGCAANGREAVKQVRLLKPDVVVMDIGMPELNGIDAARQIRDVAPFTQVIILSMHATSEHIFQALEAGAKGYVLKSSAGQEVVAAVRAVRAGHRYLSERISDTVTMDYLRAREKPEDRPLDRLSSREREVLQLVVEGKSSREIADIIHLSSKSVDTYRSRLMTKLDIHDVPGLVKFAIQCGLTTAG